jgi:hypothetical protein
MGAASPSAARSMRRCVYARRPAALRAHHPQHPLEQPAERAAAADRAREEICGGVGIVALVLFELD